VFFITVKYCVEVMRGKLLKVHSIGGTAVMYVIVINCEYCCNFVAVKMHMFSQFHDIAATD